MPHHPRGVVGPPNQPDLPPGQYATTEFPVVSGRPPPHITTAQWTLTLTTGTGPQRIWSWAAFRALPAETFTVDLHSACGWSKISTTWVGVPLGILLDGVPGTADSARLLSFSGYATTVPLEDLEEMPTWIAHQYEGRPISAVHGGPARLLIPHLYLFKSVKWVSGITLSDSVEPDRDEPDRGEPDRDETDRDETDRYETAARDRSRERGGHHHYGDPWREQRWHDA